MLVKSITEAKAQLSALVEKALTGEDVIIGKMGKPVVALSAYTYDYKPRTPGALKGKVKIADDFDTLPSDIAQIFGIGDI
ncbi:MAG: type II toxin-antitoxin system prevent-host-death family antitoxin [Kiritimatiellae bacterium]|nr:type II toxin-antitoxin system prevent-host-death family antitoxin [Kiritimatiellia bacterium]